MLRVAREGAPGGARAAQRRVQYESLFIRTAVAVGSSGDQSESVLARPEAAASTASLALAKREQGISRSLKAAHALFVLALKRSLDTMAAVAPVVIQSPAGGPTMSDSAPLLTPSGMCDG